MQIIICDNGFSHAYPHTLVACASRKVKFYSFKVSFIEKATRISNQTLKTQYNHSNHPPNRFFIPSSHLELDFSQKTFEE